MTKTDDTVNNDPKPDEPKAAKFRKPDALHKRMDEIGDQMTKLGQERELLTAELAASEAQDRMDMLQAGAADATGAGKSAYDEQVALHEPVLKGAVDRWTLLNDGQAV